MFVTSYSVTYIRTGKTGNLFSLLLCSLWWVQIVGYALQIVLLCLYSTPSHYHHCAKLSEDIELIKCLSRYILSSVWVRLNILSQLSIIQYVGLCVFSLPISLVTIARIYILCLIIIIKSEVWTITHCLMLGHDTMVCTVCLSIFLCSIVASMLNVKVLSGEFHQNLTNEKSALVVKFSTTDSSFYDVMGLLM